MRDIPPLDPSSVVLMASTLVGKETLWRLRSQVYPGDSGGQSWLMAAPSQRVIVIGYTLTRYGCWGGVEFCSLMTDHYLDIFENYVLVKASAK